MALPDYATSSRLLTRDEVMELFGIGHNFLWKLTYHKNPERRLPSYKISARCLKYKYDEVMWWLEKQKV